MEEHSLITECAVISTPHPVNGHKSHICHFIVKEVAGVRGYGQIISQNLPRYFCPTEGLYKVRSKNSSVDFKQRWDEFLLDVLSCLWVMSTRAAGHKACNTVWRFVHCFIIWPTFSRSAKQ